MRMILLSLYVTACALTTQVQAAAPTNCRIGSWVIIVNDQNKSSKQDILKAMDVINRASNVLKVSRRTVQSDESIVYNLDRNPNNPDTSHGRALEQRTIHNIYGTFLALKGMDFYCWSN